MDEAEAQRQINQMVNFITNEAKDKAAEIEAKSLEDFNIEKMKLMQQMKDKIRQEYRKKGKQLEVQKFIARSTAINHARLRNIQARSAAVEEVAKHCSRALGDLTTDPSKYGRVLTDLIVQATMRVLEDQLLVRCRKEDESLVASCLDQASRRYSEILKREAGVDVSVRYQIDTAFYLPPGPGINKDGQPAGPCCTGGIMVTSMNRKIICDNTLDTRLGLVVKECLPQIRKVLFS